MIEITADLTDKLSAGAGKLRKSNIEKTLEVLGHASKPTRHEILESLEFAGTQTLKTLFIQDRLELENEISAPSARQTRETRLEFNFPSLSERVSITPAIEDFLCAGYKYYDLVQMSEEDLQAEGFITDYHALRFLSNMSAVAGSQTASVIVALSNLLRYADEEGIGEIFLPSLRIKKTRSGFLIVEY